MEELYCPGRSPSFRPLSLIHILDEMNTADIVITGEGRVDAQTEKGKVPHAVGKAGLERGVPVIVVGGGLDDSILHKHPPEYSCLFDSTVRPMVTQRAMDRIDAKMCIRDRDNAESILAASRSLACSARVVISMPSIIEFVPSVRPSKVSMTPRPFWPVNGLSAEMRSRVSLVS